MALSADCPECRTLHPCGSRGRWGAARKWSPGIHVQGRGGRTHLGKRGAGPQGRVTVEDSQRLHQRGEGQAPRREQLGMQGHAGQKSGGRVIESEVHRHGSGAVVDPPAGPEAAQGCVGCRPAKWCTSGQGVHGAPSPGLAPQIPEASQVPGAGQTYLCASPLLAWAPEAGAFQRREALHLSGHN